MLRKKNKTSNSLVAYLLSSVNNYQDHVADLLTSSAEQRLARVLLRLRKRFSQLDRGPAGEPGMQLNRGGISVIAAAH